MSNELFLIPVVVCSENKQIYVALWFNKCLAGGEYHLKKTTMASLLATFALSKPDVNRFAEKVDNILYI